MALGLYLGTHSAEQYSVAGFLARHQRRDVFYREHVRNLLSIDCLGFLADFCLPNKDTQGYQQLGN